MKALSRSLGLIAASVGLVISFQNCSPSFKTAELESFSSESIGQSNYTGASNQVPENSDGTTTPAQPGNGSGNGGGGSTPAANTYATCSTSAANAYSTLVDDQPPIGGIPCLGPQNYNAEYLRNHPKCDAPVGSKCFYVSPNIDPVADVNRDYPGTFEQPGSFYHIIPKLGAGDILYVLPGVYNKGQFYSGNGSAYNNAKAVLTIEGGFKADNLPTANKPVTIKGLIADNGQKAVIDGQVSARINVSADNISDNSSSKYDCIYLMRASNLIIDGLVVKNCYNIPIKLQVVTPKLTNVTFRNLEMFDHYYFDNAGFIYVDNAASIVIENSVFHDYLNPEGFLNGAYLKYYRSTDVTIRNNIFYGQGNGFFYKHGEVGSAKRADGTLIDGQGGYTRIHNNIFISEEADDTSGLHTNQNRTEIYNNLFIGNATRQNGGVGVHNEGGTTGVFTYGVKIKNNTFINSGASFSRNGDYDGGRYGVVRDNIFYNSSFSFWHYGTDADYSRIPLDMDSNCFYSANNNLKISYFGAGGSWGNLGGIYATLSAWQNVPGLVYDDNSIQADPLLSSDYTPQANSPCKTKGAQNAPVVFQ